MIPKSKAFDILICAVLLFFNGYNPSPDPDNIFVGHVLQVKESGEIAISLGSNIKEYFLYGLDYKGQSPEGLEGYITYIDGMIVGSKVRVVEINNKAVLYWYKFNLNLQMIENGFFKLQDCDLIICDEWEMEAEKYQLQRLAVEKMYGHRF